ncbi:MAG: T9SS type A sorting domain-containing protein [Bacteroidia bacterium]|nr:T9SS type A sorting domain-containing protein [Bacteroidia bacterium]
MKKFYKILSIAAIALGIGSNASAQMANGTTCPDLNLTDLNGNQYNLYTILNSGKTVFIDVSAAWCGPCWGFHQTGILEELYNTYGPAGTNEVMVFFIEGESTNSLAQLQGTTTSQGYDGFSQGDWIAGTPYPICDDATAANALDIGFFPTLYMICPSKKVWHISPSEVMAYWTAEQHHTNAMACTNPIDAELISYVGDAATCSAVDLKVKIQNKGVDPLTAATIVASNNGTQVASYDWSGNLLQFQEATVTVGNTLLAADANIDFAITTPNDVIATNNSTTGAISMAPVVTSQTVTVKITTDQYGSETTWKIRKGNNAVVAGGSGGPYTDQSAVGEYAQADVTVTLPATDCYKFVVSDGYGDGMCCDYGNGSYQVLDGSGNVLLQGGSFGSEETKKMNAQFVGIEEAINTSSFNVYPNPTNGVATVGFEVKNASTLAIEITNVAGQVVFKETKSVMPGAYIYPIDLTANASGLYFVKVATGDSNIVTKINLSK